jgi:hypothetical protein
MDKNKTKGQKMMTRAGSVPVRLAKGGKELVRDTSKSRKYRIRGE